MHEFVRILQLLGQHQKEVFIAKKVSQFPIELLRARAQWISFRISILKLRLSTPLKIAPDENMSCVDDDACDRLRPNEGGEEGGRGLSLLRKRILR